MTVLLLMIFKQCCALKVYSWSHSTKQLKLRQYSSFNKSNITHLRYLYMTLTSKFACFLSVENLKEFFFSPYSDWQVFETCASNEEITTSADLNWSVNSYVIHIKRNTTYYFYNLLLPSLVLSLLSMLMFLLPPQSGKVNLFLFKK